jgi:hypothetical protein
LNFQPGAGDTKSFFFADTGVDESDGGMPVTKSEFNQLKFVCLQLYVETTNLDIKYNDLHFSSKREQAAVSFAAFSQQCSPLIAS